MNEGKNMIVATHTSIISPIPRLRQGNGRSLPPIVHFPKRKHLATCAAFQNKFVGTSLPDFLLGTATAGLIYYAKQLYQRAVISSLVTRRQHSIEVHKYIDRFNEAEQLVQKLRSSNEHVILYGRCGIGKGCLIKKASTLFSGIFPLYHVNSVENMLKRIGGDLCFQPHNKPEGFSLLNFAGRAYHKSKGEKLVLYMEAIEHDEFRVFLEAAKNLDSNYIILVLVCAWGRTKRGLIQACKVSPDEKTINFMGPIQPIRANAVVNHMHTQFGVPVDIGYQFYKYSGGNLSLLFLSVVPWDNASVEEIKSKMLVIKERTLRGMGFIFSNNRAWVGKLLSTMVSNGEMGLSDKEFENLIPDGASVNRDLFVENNGRVYFSSPVGRDAALSWLQSHLRATITE